jgi:hypothetical protein
MAKAVKLNIKPEFNFLLFGIVTSEPNYRLSWLINQSLDISLKEAPAIKLYHQKRQIIQQFGMFNYTNNLGFTYQLIHNKSEQGYLLEEYKQIDFLLKIKGESSHAPGILQKLKEGKNISLAFEIKPGQLKSKNRLIFPNNPLHE